MWIVKVILLVLVFKNVNSAKILGVFPVSARSHYILGSSLMRGLAEKGHDVTVVSAFSEEKPPKGGSYRDIVLTGFKEQHDELIKSFLNKTQSKIPMIFRLSSIGQVFINMTENTLKHPNVQALINSDEKFDVVIIEEFMNDALKALAPHFGGHLVMLSTIGANPWVNGPLGNPNPLSYISDPMMGFPPDMTFLQRAANMFIYVFRMAFGAIVVLPQQEQMIKTYFPNVEPSLTEIQQNITLFLLNSHISTNQPVPYVPQMIDIGGFHVNPPKKLPKDLQKYLDGAKNGVIYFSLGSNVKSSTLPEEQRQIFINVLSKLKEDILWKWEEDVLPDKPDNVKIAKWLPQQDILAHPNVKLFITHSGLLSTIETIYHGMPVLAIPMGGDQLANAKQMVNQGVGLSVALKDLTEELFSDALHKVLAETKYRENAQIRSKVFHDRQVKPLDSAVYWVEYIIRHNGAPHLRVAAIGMPFYKYFLLDVIALVAICGLVGVCLAWRVVKFICSKCSGKSKSKAHVSKSKKNK